MTGARRAECDSGEALGADALGSQRPGYAGCADRAAQSWSRDKGKADTRCGSC
jgi:hypothetical protein